MLARNILLMSTTLFSKLVANTLVFVIIARFFDVEGFGYFMYLYTITTLINLFLDYGFNTRMVKEISQTPSNVSEIVNKNLTAKLLIMAAMLLVGIIIFIFNKTIHEFIWGYWFLFFSFCFGSVVTFLNSSFRGVNKFHEETKVSLISNLVHFIVIIAILLINPDIASVALGFMLSKLISLYIVIDRYSKTIGKLKLWNGCLELSVRILMINLPYAVHIIVGSLNFQIDTLIIHSFLGETGVGLYQSGIRVLIGLLVLAEVLNSVYLPKLSAISKDRTTLIGLGKAMNRYMLIAGGVCSVLLIGFSDLIVSVLYGSNFKSVSGILVLFSGVLFLRFLGTTYGTILTISDRQRTRALAVVIALMASVAANFLLIPRFGLNGAIYSSYIMSLTLNIIYMISTWKTTKSLLFDARTIAIGSIAILSIAWMIGVDSKAMTHVIVTISCILISIIGISSKEICGITGVFTRRRNNWM